MDSTDIYTCHTIVFVVLQKHAVIEANSGNLLDNGSCEASCKMMSKVQEPIRLVDINVKHEYQFV